MPGAECSGTAGKGVNRLGQGFGGPGLRLAADPGNRLAGLVAEPAEQGRRDPFAQIGDQGGELRFVDQRGPVRPVGPPSSSNLSDAPASSAIRRRSAARSIGLLR